MKEFTIGPNDAGQRLDRFLAKAVPLLPASLAQKYIRLKRIKCNGKRIDRDTRLNAGDVLQLYINDEFFDKPRTSDPVWLSIPTTALNTAVPSSIISSPICIRNGNGGPERKMPLPPLCATGSTGTPAALSSPPRPPKPSGS